MKIYKKQDFLKLPPGIFFAKGVQWSMDGFCVKGDSLLNDFFYLDLIQIDASGSDQLFDRYEEMLSKGTSYPIKEYYSRDGIFCDEDIFLVFEKGDLIFIKNMIEKYET